MAKLLKPSYRFLYRALRFFFFKVLFASAILSLLFWIASLKSFLNTSDVDFRSNNSFVSPSLTTNVNLHFNETTIGCCHDIAGIAVHDFIMRKLGWTVGIWSVCKVVSNWLQLLFLLCFFERLSWAFCLYYIILAIIIFFYFLRFLLFSIFFRLEKGTRRHFLFGNTLPRKFLTYYCRKMLLGCRRYYL